MKAPVLIFAMALVLSLAPARAARERVSPSLRAAMQEAPAGEPIAVWVFLADRGGNTALALAEAEAGLTPPARARRARNRGADRLVDVRDLPVAGARIEALRTRATRVRHVSRWLNAVSVEAVPSAIDGIAALPFVARVDVVRGGRAPLPVPEQSAPPTGAPGSRSVALVLDYGSSFTQNNQINTPVLHDLGYSGNGVIICMMDSGFNNPGHPAFQSMNILVTRDFVNGDSVVVDEPGQMGSGNHGTYTLSTIGGYAPGELIGPAYGATYVLAKTENTDWERHIEEDAWVAAAEWADSIGADIISSSLAYSTGFTDGEPSYTWEDMDGNTTIVTIGADIAASRGILVVNSAGNDGLVSEPANTLAGPCDGDSVLAIAAVDGLGVRVGFSSVGLSADGRIKPDLAAMGLSVRCASPFEPAAYMNVSGTSLSCPLAAGAAALLLEARPNATNAQIMDALRQTASQAGAPDRLLGWGVIDVAAALAFLPTAAAPGPPAPATFSLSAHPNPFNPATTIDYAVPARARVTLDVFDVRGARVATLVDEVQSAGRRSVTWNARDRGGEPLASGVYLVRLVSGSRAETRKIVLLK